MQENTPQNSGTVLASEQTFRRSATQEDLRQIAAQFNVRRISSRQMIELSRQLMSCGAIGMEEHAMMAFQPELNASYDFVGAQGCKRPNPDNERDVLAEWEQILDTQQRFNAHAVFVEKSRNIVGVLTQLASLRPGA
jgi:hypothetical protein